MLHALKIINDIIYVKHALIKMYDQNNIIKCYPTQFVFHKTSTSSVDIMLSLHI